MSQRFVVAIAAIAALGISLVSSAAQAADSRSGRGISCKYGMGLTRYYGKSNCEYDPYAVYLAGYPNRYYPGPDRSMIVDQGRCNGGMHRMCNVYGVCWVACD